ncbi:TPA: hypothetical protein I9Y37_001858 [Citrobacter freundii]|nr:hypothetical protein [Citrobacter freundii]HAT3963836.1 hypothetical protein [Citrobacter freundii]
MEPYQERVIAEARELKEKLDKLTPFVQPEHPIFSTLPLEDRTLFHAQHGAMKAYLSILEIRISRF